jgi:arylsulfatase A-like enzyme
MVNRIDENVGRLMSTLDELGIREDTLIVYTSDHGHDFVFRWNPQPKRNCYDTASRIPLIFHWKGRFQNGVCSELVSHVDLAPTILDLCGVAIPPGIQGRSAKGLLLGSPSAWRDSVYIQNCPFRRDGRHSEEGKDAAMFERCLVTTEWKLISQQ